MAQAMKANTVTSRRGTSSAHDSPVLEAVAQKITVSVTIATIAKMEACAMNSTIFVRNVVELHQLSGQPLLVHGHSSFPF